MGARAIDCRKDYCLLRRRMVQLIAPWLSGNNSSGSLGVWGWLARRGLLVNTSDAWVMKAYQSEPMGPMPGVTYTLHSEAVSEAQEGDSAELSVEVRDEVP